MLHAGGGGQDKRLIEETHILYITRTVQYEYSTCTCRLEVRLVQATRCLCTLSLRFRILWGPYAGPYAGRAHQREPYSPDMY